MENYTDEQFQADTLEYEEMKLEEKENKKRLDILKERIQSRIQGDEKVNTRYGVIEVKKRDNWKYSEGTTKMAEELKETQKTEIAKGIAISTPTVFIEYRQKDETGV